MKNVLLIALVFSGSLAHAKLDSDCKRSMERSALNYRDVEARINDGTLTGASASMLLSMTFNTSKTVALSCAGIEQIKMQNSVRNKLGLLSEEEFEQRSNQTYEEALAYFNSLIQN